MKNILFFFLTMIYTLCYVQCSAQWKFTNGPIGSGATINCLTVIGDNLYAGTDGGRVY